MNSSRLLGTYMVSLAEKAHLGLGDDLQAEFLVDERGGGLREVALVGYEAAPPEAAGAAHLVEVFGPFGVQVAVRLLRFGFEHTDDFLPREKQSINRRGGAKGVIAPPTQSTAFHAHPFKLVYLGPAHSACCSLARPTPHHSNLAPPTP